jgi:hypothetical protein
MEDDVSEVKANNSLGILVISRKRYHLDRIIIKHNTVSMATYRNENSKRTLRLTLLAPSVSLSY